MTNIPIQSLYVLLDPAAAEISSGLLIVAESFEVMDSWDELDREAVWEHLHAIEVVHYTVEHPSILSQLIIFAGWLRSLAVGHISSTMMMEG